MTSFIFRICLPNTIRVAVKRGGWGTQTRRSRPVIIEGQKVNTATVDSQQLANLYRATDTLTAQAIANAHAPSTLKSYGSGWNSWVRFAQVFQFECLCKDYNLPVCIGLVKRYISYECGLRQLSPKSISGVYLPGIADQFDRLGAFNYFRDAIQHNHVKVLTGGYLRGYNARHPECGKVRIPFDSSMAIDGENHIKSGSLVIKRFLTYDGSTRAKMGLCRIMAALFLGIFYLLRKGEYLPKQAKNHSPFQRRHLRFYDKSKNVIAYADIGRSRAYSLSITLVFSKADQTGRSRIVHHEANFDRPLDCVVHRLQEYITASRDLYGAQEHDLLFELPATYQFPVLTAETLTFIIREICGALGLPKDQASAHSLRYGGAYMLAMMGLPEYVIAWYGGWAVGSTALRKYVQISPDVISRVSRHMSMCASTRSVQDMVRSLLANRVPTEMLPAQPQENMKGTKRL